MQILNPSSNRNTNKAEGLAVCPLDRHCKCVVPLPAQKANSHRFAFGTFENSDQNEIRTVDFDEESYTFSQSTLLNDLPPVDQLSDFYSSQGSTQLLVSLKDPVNKGSFLGVLSLSAEFANTPGPKGVLNRIDRRFESIKRVSVDPHSSAEASRFSVLTRDQLFLFKNLEEELFLKPTPTSVDKYSGSFMAGRFDPHHKDLFALTTDNYFQVLDLRQDNSTRLRVRSHAHHRGSVLDLSFNPNLPNELATTGEDAQVLFWDLRNTHKPLSEFSSEHGHWTRRLEYNSFHDQLLLSCGAGGTLLHRRDEKLNVVAHKPDSCYDVCWSYDDAWFYCSVIASGLRVEMVPKSLKAALL